MTNQERSELMEIVRELSYEERDVTLASGRKSNFYFDGKQTALHARGGLLVGKAFWEIVKTFAGPIHGVGGLTMGADPIATATSIASNLAGEPVHAFEGLLARALEPADHTHVGGQLDAAIVGDQVGEPSRVEGCVLAEVQGDSAAGRFATQHVQRAQGRLEGHQAHQGEQLLRSSPHQAEIVCQHRLIRKSSFYSSIPVLKESSAAPSLFKCFLVSPEIGFNK